MKDPSYTIRDYYATTLEGNIIYEGRVVPVYDGMADDKAETPYIVLGNQTISPRDSLCSFDSECSIIVIVTSSFPAADRGNKKEIDDISNLITQIMLPHPTYVLNLGPEFHCLNIAIDGMNSSSSQDQTHQYYDKAIRFNHIIQEA